jgi:hypothetical protein
MILKRWSDEGQLFSAMPSSRVDQRLESSPQPLDERRRAMSIFTYDVVIPREAEEILDFTIQQGESLLRYGAEDFGQILTRLNLADLTLEIIPSCRESLYECLDWFATNRERIETALAILRDATTRVHNPLYAALLHPSDDYRALMERVLGRGSPVFNGGRHPSLPRSLSCRDFSLEEEQ